MAKMSKAAQKAFAEKNKKNLEAFEASRRSSNQYIGGKKIDLNEVLKEATGGRIGTVIEKWVDVPADPENEDDAPKRDVNVPAYIRVENGSDGLRLWACSDSGQGAHEVMAVQGGIKDSDVDAIFQEWDKAAQKLGLRQSGPSSAPATPAP